MFVTQWHKKSSGKDTTFPFRMADPKVSCKVPARPVGKRKSVLLINFGKMKLEIIEHGRISNDELSLICGGAERKYKDCSDANGCPTVTGSNLTTQRNCAYKLYICSDGFSLCINDDDLSSCDNTLATTY